MSWRDDAECARAVRDGEVLWDDFFPELTQGEGRTWPKREDVQRAVACCHVCPVGAECEQELRKLPIQHRIGIWNGKLYGVGRPGLKGEGRAA